MALINATQSRFFAKNISSFKICMLSTTNRHFITAKIYIFISLTACLLNSCEFANQNRLLQIEKGQIIAPMQSEFFVRSLTDKELERATIDSISTRTALSTFTHHLLDDDYYDSVKIDELEQFLRKKHLLDRNAVQAITKGFFYIGMHPTTAYALIRATGGYYGPELVNSDPDRRWEKWHVAQRMGVNFFLCFIGDELTYVSNMKKDPHMHNTIQQALMDDRRANAFLWGYDWTSNSWHVGMEKFADRVGRC